MLLRTEQVCTLHLPGAWAWKGFGSRVRLSSLNAERLDDKTQPGTKTNSKTKSTKNGHCKRHIYIYICVFCLFFVFFAKMLSFVTDHSNQSNFSLIFVSFTWNSIVRFLSESDGWTLFGALACLRRVGPMMTPSPGFLCRLPAKLLQRVRNSWGSSNPESSRMHSGKDPRRLLWLALLGRHIPGPEKEKLHSTYCLDKDEVFL